MEREQLAGAFLVLALVGGVSIPVLGMWAGLTPALSIVVLPTCYALVLYWFLRGTYWASIVSMLVLQASALITLTSPMAASSGFGLDISDPFRKLVDFLKFAIAAMFMGFVFLVTLGIRKLGKPGAFIASVVSMALASGIAFARLSPMGGAWEISPESVLVFILLASVIFGIIVAVGGRS